MFNQTTEISPQRVVERDGRLCKRGISIPRSRPIALYKGRFLPRIGFIDIWLRTRSIATRKCPRIAVEKFVGDYTNWNHPRNIFFVHDRQWSSTLDRSICMIVYATRFRRYSIRDEDSIKILIQSWRLEVSESEDRFIFWGRNFYDEKKAGEKLYYDTNFSVHKTHKNQGSTNHTVNISIFWNFVKL